MRIQEIRKMIQEAVRDEERTRRLAEAAREVAKRGGANPTPEQIKGVVDFVRGYIEHVPNFLEQGAAAARRVGLGAEMDQMMGELEVYWFTADDLIPDRLGLMGLMDDAYASLVLLQAISDYCRASVGRPLLEQDLTQANRAVHLLIGEPVATQLDQRVGVTIGQAMMQRVLSQIATAGAFSFGAGPDPIWGNASAEEIAKVRLGALGVV